MGEGIFVTWYCYKEVLPGSLGVSMLEKMKNNPHAGKVPKGGVYIVYISPYIYYTHCIPCFWLCRCGRGRGRRGRGLVYIATATHYRLLDT